ncbi:SIS domain-containing protein [Pelagibacteraceae bacterium]|nr:SIS domain-containing protein [Pelagibacteraceae bacterium]
MNLIEDYFSKHIEIAKKIDFESMKSAVNLIINTFNNGNNVFTCGNGGSAHTASHFITDWVKMAETMTGKKLNGYSLNDNIGMITAFANDYNYDEIFVGQLKSYLRENDLVVAVSGSGNSRNVVKAIDYANKMKANTLAIVGYDGGVLKKTAKQNFHVPSFDMQICEDIHLKFGHVVMKQICNIEIID